jgi:hypothetical protein
MNFIYSRFHVLHVPTAKSALAVRPTFHSNFSPKLTIHVTEPFASNTLTTLSGIGLGLISVKNAASTGRVPTAEHPFRSALTRQEHSRKASQPSAGTKGVLYETCKQLAPARLCKDVHVTLSSDETMAWTGSGHCSPQGTAARLASCVSVLVACFGCVVWTA